MPNLAPLSVFLVKKGGTGDRVLFRYPYSEPPRKSEDNVDPKRNPYAVKYLPEDMSYLGQLSDADQQKLGLEQENVVLFPSEILSNLFSAHPK